MVKINAVINHDGVTGKMMKGITTFINISSCPPDQLDKMLKRVPNIPEVRRYHPLNAHIMYSIKEKKIIHKVTKKGVVLISDSDDIQKHWKMMRIERYIGVYIAGEIMFQYPSNENETIELDGDITRIMVNPHYTYDTMMKLGVTSPILGNYTNEEKVHVKLVDDCHIGSIAGLVSVLAYYKIPYKIEKVEMELDKIWMTIEEPDFYDHYTLDKLELDTHGRLEMVQNWQYSQGYTSYMNTDKGPKKIQYLEDDKRHEWHKKMEHIIKGILMKIVGFIEWIKEKVLIMVGDITSVMRKNERNENNDF